MQKLDEKRTGGSDKEARRGPSGSFPTAPTPTAAQAFQLRAAIRGIHWDAGKKLLDLLEVTIANDRRFEIARKQAMDIIANANRYEDTAINQVLFPARSAEQGKE